VIANDSTGVMRKLNVLSTAPAD